MHYTYTWIMARRGLRHGLERAIEYKVFTLRLLTEPEPGPIHRDGRPYYRQFEKRKR